MGADPAPANSGPAPVNVPPIGGWLSLIRAGSVFRQKLSVVKAALGLPEQLRRRIQTICRLVASYDRLLPSALPDHSFFVHCLD
jgi:hypothetical protein